MKEARLMVISPPQNLAGEEGFEPSLPGPEPGVLPLDYSPVSDVTELKSSPLPGLLSDILPAIVALATPQKAAGIGQQIQSLLSNPLPVSLHCLGQLCNKRIASPTLRGQLLKYQPVKADTAGILFTTATRGQVYNILADNGKETIPLAAPPTLRETITRSADETDTLMAPLRCRDLLRRWHHAN